MAVKQDELTRENKIMNSVINTSIILMSTLLDGFGELVIGATTTMASGVAEVVGGERAKEEAQKEFEQKMPQVTEKMRLMISDIRKGLYEQMEQKRKVIEPLISDPVFDLGPETIEKYDFGIPKLTQEIDDGTLAKYTYLLLSENATFGELFGLLGDWMNSLPQFPGKK